MRFQILLVFILFYSASFAQISIGGQPVSWTEVIQSGEVPLIILPEVDIDSLKKEDKINDQDKSKPWRFGFPHQVNIKKENAGTWIDLGSRGKLWMLRIKSDQAKSINITFDRFHIPPKAKLFIYNKSETHVLGAFTHKNNNISKTLGTDLLPGEEIIVEYFEPHDVPFEGELSIGQVTHGYRGLAKSGRDFGDSGFCNINVNCPLGDNWQEQKRSVAIILVGGFSFCSGALVNNVNEDETPYFLTADHCISGSVNSWVFRFNYESPDCSNTNGSTSQSVSGASVVARNSNSDFALLELSASPPLSFNPFYAGWDNSGNVPQNQTTIHHPSGDIKKISFDDDNATKLAGTFQYWEIGQWEHGTTEGGSSGAPLFDQNQRVIGQLQGGAASCTNISNDFYGRLDASWEGATPNQRLKDWLDPTSLGIATLDGFDPNNPRFDVNASPESISYPEKRVCGNAITPQIQVKNKGKNTITSLSLLFSLDGGSIQTHNWTGNLLKNQSTSIQLPEINVSQGNHSLQIITTDPNGVTDEEPVGDTIIQTFDVFHDGLEYQFFLQTDNKGSETSWSIKDESNNEIYAGGPYPDINGGEQRIQALCLPEGCYTLIVEDTNANGMCCSNGSGGFELQNPLAQPIKVSNGQFSNMESFFFCVENLPTNLSRNIYLDMYLNIYPNPATEQLVIKTSNHSGLIKINSLLGQTLSEKQVNLSNTSNVIWDVSTIPQGIYIITFDTKQGTIAKKVQITR